MEDIFKPQSLTIKALFGNQDALYQIPRYQRPYSWGDDQLDKLWSDLREAQENEPNYFLGSIITAKPEEASNYLDIVDGQQRLTTLLILLCVCRDLYPNLNSSILDSDPFAIDHNIIKNSIRYNDRFTRLRLITHSNHSSDFETKILNEGNSILNKKPLKKELRLEECPQHKFSNTSTFFREKLEGIGEEEAGRFMNYLFNNTKIIRIDCYSVSFAIKLFQVLNDRGLDLSNSDLIKSFLVGIIHKKFSEDNEIKKQKEDQFMDDWKACEMIALETNESINNLFVLYEYYLLAKNPEKSLYDELIKLFENRDPNEIIKDFKDFISLYKNEVYESTNEVIYSFYYLRWTMYWKTIVVTALHTSYTDYDRLLIALRKYFYINWIAGNTLSKIKQTSFNLISWIKSNRSIEEIEEILSKQIENDTTRRAIQNLGGEIYFEPWCKALLFMLEYKQLDAVHFFAMGDRNIQTEHIIPRAYEKNPDWKEIKKIENIDTWIHTGANLTLLSGKKNIKASNDGFSTKILAYDGTGLDGSKATQFIITQKIMNDYKAGTYNKQWNKDSMNDRWQWFCTQIEDLFDIDLLENKKREVKAVSSPI